VAASWWPASGLALGLALLLPSRRLWLAAGAVAVALFGANLAQYGSLPLAAAASAAAGIELSIGALVLRSRGAKQPRLETYADLGMLLLAVAAAATAYCLTISLATAAMGDNGDALVQLLGAGPRRAAGMLLVVPLFMGLAYGARRLPASRTAFQICLSLVVSAAVFGVNDSLPLAFLAIVAPVWGALWMAPRWLLVEMLGIAFIGSCSSVLGRGPFSFSRFGPDRGSTLLQAFELTMVTIVLLISLTVARERKATSRLRASEAVFRRNFETSLSGMIVVVNAGPSWRVHSYNGAALRALPQLGGGAWELAHLLGLAAAKDIILAASQVPVAPCALNVQVIDGRHFQASVVPLDLEDRANAFAIQLLDVTDSHLAQLHTATDRERARQVQLALSPGDLPARAGWSHGAAAVSARHVGGDFYDLRIEGRRAVLTLGDVMGKGVGAAILAAEARTALRSVDLSSRPAEALADGARIIDDDLRRSDAFVTLGHASIDLVTGRVRLADAGHGLSFALRNGSGGVERLASYDLPLGIGNTWTELNLVLSPGESLIMVSDGVLDRWGGSVPQLVAAISALRADPAIVTPQLMADALCNCVAWAPSPGDDATAVILCRDGIRS
jgi:sigma-B regulation protein RsbU (phosphoserine phosphatase)